MNVETAGRPFRIADGDAVVTAQKVFTRMGERLELVSESLGTSVRLDAIALESVAWQDAGELAALAREVDRGNAVAPRSDDVEEREDPLTVSSEFAQAQVETATDGDREVLEISAPKLGYDIRLGPRELEWLTTQDHDRFTEWLETPFGPGGEEHDHGH